MFIFLFLAVRFYFSGPEILFAAEQQLEAAGGVGDTTFATVKVTVDEKDQIVVEAFQVELLLNYFCLKILPLQFFCTF